MVAQPADFGGTCLIGECAFTADLLLPSTTYLGLHKTGSYLYASLRDADDNLLRVLRAVEAEKSSMRSVFVARPGGQLEHDVRSARMWSGATSIVADRDTVVFESAGADNRCRFRFTHTPARCRWTDADTIELAGDLVGPGVQWFNTWGGGACLSATSKYRVRGACLGRSVEGFVGHEIHYFTPGFNWLTAPYGLGREICWQQIANEYDDGSLIQATFAYGADGWGFAMLHDEHGAFLATTDVRATATVSENGYPQTIRYQFANQSWTWRIDPQGRRPAIADIAMIGADGTCVKDDEQRSVRYSMGNSDWWTDGRATPITRRDP